MTTYSQMIINDRERRNPVNIYWIYAFGNFTNDETNPNKIRTLMSYEDAESMTQEWFGIRNMNIHWKIVDSVTGKNLKDNKGDRHYDILGNPYEDYDEDDNRDAFYNQDKKLRKAYKKALRNAKQEALKKLAIKKILRNSIYNNGLGLKLAVKAYEKEI